MWFSLFLKKANMELHHTNTVQNVIALKKFRKMVKLPFCAMR